MSKDNCILYFTLTPESEAFRKSLSHSRKANLKVIEKLYRHTKNVILDSHIDCVEVNEEAQIGVDFGSRLQNAISDVFNLGYKNVIVVGNDCIDIQKEDLLQAQSHLEFGYHTIGKTIDGGVYLFTVSEDTFNKDAFRQLSWSQKSLGSELFTWVTSVSQVCLLQTKRDINSYNQLLSWAITTRHFLRSFFRNILVYVSKSLKLESFILSLVYRKIHFLRGPPAVL